MNITVTQTAAALCGADDILILTHRRPDGDTTGCAGALCRGLRQLGKTAYILPNAEITTRYAPMITPCYPPADFNAKYIVTTDIAAVSLLPDNALPLLESIDLVIDHHRANDIPATQKIVRSTAGACGELVYEILHAMGVTLDLDIAHCLYLAVSTDTGCFRYSNTTPDTLRVAALCLEAGIDGGEINRAVFETKSHARFEMERIVFDTMEFLLDGALACVILRRADIDRTGATPDDLDSIAALTRQIEGVQVGITLTEHADGSSKASVRTTKEVDASAICAQLGGGGHLRAAGANLDCSADEMRIMILKAAQEVYEQSNCAL